MKPREFKLNLALSPSLNIGRLYRYIGNLSGSYKPTAKGKALRRRNARRIVRGSMR